MLHCKLSARACGCVIWPYMYVLSCHVHAVQYAVMLPYWLVPTIGPIYSDGLLGVSAGIGMPLLAGYGGQCGRESCADSRGS